MPTIRRALFCASLLVCATATPAERDHLVDGKLARTMAEEIHAVLSTDALPPRSRAEFDAALAALRKAASAELVSEKLLHARVNRLLGTIDSDGHTHLIPRQRMKAAHKPFAPASRPAAAAPAYTLTLEDATVLVVAPPPTTTQGGRNIVQAADSFLDAVRTAAGAGEACALVVDLSGQTGGNAWPGIASLADLLTPANTAQVEARDGKRAALTQMGDVEYYTMQLRDENRQLLSRFRELPFAVVVSRNTSSAGEMIGILLKGEPRSRVFGWPTGGYTTVNRTVTLATGDALAVSVARYAFDGQPAIRGSFVPDVAFTPGDAKDAPLRQAAAWARAQSPACARVPRKG